jgi:hypothetical protein
MRPSWTYTEKFSSWEEDKLYPMTIRKYLTEVQGGSIAIVLLLILASALILEFFYTREAEKFTEISQLDHFVFAAEGIHETAAIPVPLTDEDSSYDTDKWYRWWGINSNTLGDLSGRDHTTNKNQYTKKTNSRRILRVIFLASIISMIIWAIYSMKNTSYFNPQYIVPVTLMWFNSYAFRKFLIMISIAPRFSRMLFIFASLVVALAIFAQTVYQVLIRFKRFKFVKHSYSLMLKKKMIKKTSNILELFKVSL